MLRTVINRVGHLNLLYTAGNEEVSVGIENARGDIIDELNVIGEQLVVIYQLLEDRGSFERYCEAMELLDHVLGVSEETNESDEDISTFSSHHS